MPARPVVSTGNQARCGASPTHSTDSGPMAVLIGVKVGQKRERSAVCVAENPKRYVEQRAEYHFVVRYLERLPAGVTLPAVADRLAEIVRRVGARSGDPRRLYVDATGLGQPVMDLINSRIKTTAILPVYFNHGDRRNADWEQIKLGKAFLVSRLQMLLQSERLHLPKNDQAETLAQELLEYEIKVENDANERYGAFRVGTRDDMVTALGLAVQDDGAPTNSFMRAW